jgi:hypothetical protein
MFWPSKLFDDEYREDSKRNWSKVTNDQMRACTGFGPNCWWVARKGDSYVAICSNRTTTWDTSDWKEESAMQAEVRLVIGECLFLFVTFLLYSITRWFGR